MRPRYGDAGANTLAHIAGLCARGARMKGGRGPLHLPNLDGLGLGAAVRIGLGGMRCRGSRRGRPGRWGAATEVSRGKDTPSGHWELAGVPVPWDWTYFPDDDARFSPMRLVEEILLYGGGAEDLGELPCLWHIDHRKAGGRASADGLADLLIRRADSVVQIAAHEESFRAGAGLIALCAGPWRQSVHAMKVGRVIARPFTGTVGRVYPHGEPARFCD